MATKKKALTEMTVAELQKEAKKQKVKVPSRAKKEDIIKLLTPAPAAAPATEETETAAAAAPVSAEISNQQSMNVEVRDEIWESEQRKRERLAMDPSMTAL